MKAFLKSLELFRDLSDGELELLVPLLKSESYKRGEAIFREREAGGKIYFVDCGVVEIARQGRVEGKPARVALLERGEVLGELALVDDGPRTATATAAVTPETKMVSVEVPAFQALLAQNPDMAAKVQRGLLRRISSRLRATSEALYSLVQSL